MKHEEWYFPEQAEGLEVKRSLLPENLPSFPVKIELKGESKANVGEVRVGRDGSRSVRWFEMSIPVIVYIILAATAVIITLIVMKAEIVIKKDDGVGVRIAFAETEDQPIYRDVVVADGDVHVRSSPCIEGEKLGVLMDGECAEYLGCYEIDDSGRIWYSINFNGSDIGWVSSKYANLITHMVKEKT